MLPSPVTASFCFVVWLESDGLEFPRAVVTLPLASAAENYTNYERNIYVYVCVFLTTLSVANTIYRQL